MSLKTSLDRPTIEGDPLPPKKRKHKGLWIAVLLLAALAGTGYIYRVELRNTRLGGSLLASLIKASPSKAVYYCPMHPSYKSDRPGTCPICNMNLEKLEPGTTTGEESPPPAEETAPRGKRKILYYQDPMNPANRSEKPGKAPDGMDMEPVYEEETSATGAMQAGTVKINPQKQQLIGVQYGEVQEKSFSEVIRTVGRIAYNETRVARIQPKIEGWIEKVFVDFTGQLVKKGQPLLSIYSPQLVSTQQELLIAGKSLETLGKSPFKEASAGAVSLYEATRERLRLWDISDAQVKEIEKRGAPVRTLTISSPATGFVVTRNAFPAQRITPDTELYTIADLSTVWAIADVYEYEAPLIRIGQQASMSLTYFPGKSYNGKVSYIYPDLDKTTRTLKVRIEFPNPDFRLKPDMYANVEFHVDFPRQLYVPQEAVLDSGTEQIVFVAREDGYFEPRKIRTGGRVSNHYIVLGGLKRGEKVVTSGNFLIDSESQLKSALGGMTGGGSHSAHGSPASSESTVQPTEQTRPATQTPPIDHSEHRAVPQNVPQNHTEHDTTPLEKQPENQPPAHQHPGQGG